MTAPNVVTGTAYPPRIYNLNMPIQMSGLASSQTLKIGVPHKFRVTAVRIRMQTAGAGAGAVGTLTTQISGTATTGGVISLTLATTNAAGATVAGTAITANNTGAAGSTLELAVSGVTTAYTGGTGWVEFTIQDLDNGGAQ